MLVGIDGTCWRNQRGFGRFTRELLTAMFAEPRGHEFHLFIDDEPDQEMIHPSVHLTRVHTSRTVTKAAVASGNRSLRDVMAFHRATSAKPLDILFYPAVYSWFPARIGLPSVVTLHDAIAERFPELVFPDLRRRLYWGLKVRLACRQARRILTVSSAAKDEIVEHLGIDPGRIDVISEAAHSRFHPIADPQRRASARRRANLPAEARLLLYVGGFAPHKNLSRLLLGFSQVLDRRRMEDVHLAFVGDLASGGFQSNYEELRALIRDEPKLQGRVHFTGYVADEDLVALYSDALALAIPSLSEGFGLPAIEALSCGTPVLASNRGAVPEVAGEAGLLFDPLEASEIGEAIYKIAHDGDALSALRAKALEQARKFTWRRAADLTYAVLEECGSRR